jgi:hypothetical protein
MLELVEKCRWTTLIMYVLVSPSSNFLSLPIDSFPFTSNHTTNRTHAGDEKKIQER